MADNSHTNQNRRSFGKEFLALLAGGLATIIPAATGLLVFFDPLLRRGGRGDYLKVTSLSALPEDGRPRKFPVVTSKQDAWNRYPNVPIGAVYLRRTEDGGVQALNVVCPHAGCFVDFAPSDGGYLCPCHNSTFAVDGSINDPKSPSPRPMDSLDVELRNGEEVWVKFQNYYSARTTKDPIA